MALFGRKKDPTALVEEGKKLAGLILDWLKEPLGELRNGALSDRVMTEHYLLTLCSYIAREKVSSGAWEYYHNALVQVSPYCLNYATDRQKEANYLAVSLSVLQTTERDARKKRENVMVALVAALFKDFSAYKDPAGVKRVVYKTVNRFNEEIPTTDYASLRLPNPAPAAPAAPARSYSAPAKPASPAPAPAPAAKKPADYHITDASGKPVPYNAHGKKIIYQNRIYELVVKAGGDRGLKFLDVTDRNVCVANDPALVPGLMETFARENPELKYLVRWSKPRADLPDSFSLRNNETGKDENVPVLIWEEVNGFCFGYCPRNDDSFVLVMRTGDGSYVNAGRNAMSEMALKTIMTKYPAFF